MFTLLLHPTNTRDKHTDVHRSPITTWPSLPSPINAFSRVTYPPPRPPPPPSVWDSPPVADAPVRPVERLEVAADESVTLTGGGETFSGRVSGDDVLAVSRRGRQSHRRRRADIIERRARRNRWSWGRGVQTEAPELCGGGSDNRQVGTALKTRGWIACCGEAGMCDL